MATKARSLGLNVGTFLTTVSKNIKLVNSYNFKDGVEGFTRMVARAQALRIDMTQVNKLAGDLLNPEKAVELAAEFQNLGGAIGALGDPFQLMNMAQNDMEGLQNAIVDAAKSSVMFNEKTGKFQISATEMRRLRAQADALGMSYEELANTAVKAAQEQRAMDDLRFTNLTDEQKQLISNLAQVNKNGELEITLPGMDKATKISELNSEMVGQYTKDLERIQKEEGLDALGVAKEQLGTLRDIAAALGGTAAKAVSGVAVSESFNDFKAQIREAADYTRDQLSEKLDVEKIGGKIDKLVEGGIGGLDAALGQLGIEGLSTSTIINGLVESIAGLKQKFQNWDPSGGGTGSGANSSNTPYSRENQGLKDASKTFSDLVDEKLRATGNTTELKDPFKLMEVAKNVRQNQELNITPTTNNTQQIEISDLNVNHTGTIRIEGITQTIDISRRSETDIRILSDRIKQVLSPELLGN